jgi:hypothetical protein
VKVLTNAECTEWLEERGIIEEPYLHVSPSNVGYEQFRIPRDPQRISALMRTMVEISQPFQEVLLHLKDWSLYSPDEMATVRAIRSAYGESRGIIDSPGHLWPLADKDQLIGLAALVVCYNWDTYLYFDSGTTFFCWEGDLLDC